MAQRVVVLGAGIGGLSAAHELVERGFEVEVYERNGAIAGGKARSMPASGAALDGRRALPGEHGFRFIPGFYRHLSDTLRRIPYGDNRRGVFDNIVHARRNYILQRGKPGVATVPCAPRTLDDLRVLFDTVRNLAVLGLSDDDMDHYAGCMWRMLTSCEARRRDEYERISFWDYLGAGDRSRAFQMHLADGPTRMFVASRPKTANARVIAEIATQLWLDSMSPGQSSDRVLNGPTNEVWIDPWVAHLRARGVRFHFGARVEELLCEDGVLRGVAVGAAGAGADAAPERAARRRVVTADYYVAALPVEVLAGLLSPALLRADSTLAGVLTLKDHVAWMNGIQFYLRRDVPVTRGHCTVAASPWALTFISQAQFWPDVDLAARGDGAVRGILSVDVSDWDTPGYLHGRARDCTPAQIAHEVWEQLKGALNVGGDVVLQDGDLHSWFLDPDIQNARDNPQTLVNLEPLLINLVDSWRLRPEAYTHVPNLFLAADFVRTHTALASMEGANEAARRAVNCVLDAARSRAPRCDVWPLREPGVLAPLRWYDARRYRQGRPWDPRVDEARRVVGRVVSALIAPLRAALGAAPRAADNEVAETGDGSSERVRNGVMEAAVGSLEGTRGAGTPRPRVQSIRSPSA